MTQNKIMEENKMAITTRIVSHKMGEKAHAYLDKAGGKSWILEREVIPHKNGVFTHTLSLNDGVDEGMFLESFIEVKGRKISILMICEMKINPKTGRYAPNKYGAGKSGKLLAEKFLNKFFDYLATVDINDVNERQFTLTGDLIAKVEAEIDRSIDPKRITEADIDAYDRLEMTQYIEGALKFYCEKIGEDDYTVKYSSDLKGFEVDFITSEFCIEIPLGDIVCKKWKINECLGRAAIACAAEMHSEVNERMKRDAHYIEQFIELAMPDMRKAADGDNREIERMRNYLYKVLQNQVVLYDTGKAHSVDGCSKWSRDEFIAQNDEFASVKHVTHLIDTLYLTYCDGFAESNGDTLFSGKGGVRLPSFC
jgi:hypothetical protein